MFTINENEVLNYLAVNKNESQKELIAKDKYTAEELFNLNIQGVPFLWKNLIPQTGLCCLTGSSDCNKSTLLRQLALEIAAKSDSFLGFELKGRTNKVIYLSTEDDANSIAAILRKHYPQGIPGETLKNVLFTFNTENHIHELDKELSFQPRDAVFVDTWADLFDGDINQTSKVRANLEGYKKLALKHKCAFVFIHHQGKASEGNAPSKNSLLGSQGFEAKMRTVIDLRRETGNKRLMTIVKGNYTEDKLKNKSFVLELDETRMLFHKNDDIIKLTGDYGIKGLRVKYEKEVLMKVAIPLRNSGLSFEKIHTILSEKYGKNSPGITTLKNWFLEQSDSQSPNI